jgi:hypothetical protein
MERGTLKVIKEISKVLTWLGRGDVAGAMAAVDPVLRTQAKPDVADELVADVAPMFDELYDRVDRAQGLDAAFIGALNDTNAALTARWDDVARQRLEALHATAGTS